MRENEELKKRSETNFKTICDELKQANKIIKKLHDSNQEQTEKVMKFCDPSVFVLIIEITKCLQLVLSKDIALKQKEDIHKYQSENLQLSKALDEKTSSIESLNIQYLETKNRLTVVEQNLKEKEDRLASNDKGNSVFSPIIVKS